MVRLKQLELKSTPETLTKKKVYKCKFIFSIFIASSHTDFVSSNFSLNLFEYKILADFCERINRILVTRCMNTSYFLLKEVLSKRATLFVAAVALEDIQAVVQIVQIG